MRKLSLILLCLGLAACGSKDHKIPVNRNLKGSESNTDTQTALKLAKPGKDAAGKDVLGCLNLPNVTAVFTGDAGRLYTTYTSDMDLGQLSTVSSGPNSCLQFTSSGDQLARAATYFQPSAPIKPKISRWMATDLVNGTSDIGAVLAFSSQDQCNTATFSKPIDGASTNVFNVICKNQHMITVRDPKNEMYIQYFVDANNNSLSITYFKPVNVPTNCPGSNGGSFFSKVTNVITWNGASEKLKIAPLFAELLHAYAAVQPKELSDAVLPRNPSGGKGKAGGVLAGSVSLSMDAYSYVVEQIDAGKLKDLKCQ